MTSYWPNSSFNIMATTQLIGICWQCLKFSRINSAYLCVGFGEKFDIER